MKSLRSKLQRTAVLTCTAFGFFTAAASIEWGWIGGLTVAGASMLIVEWLSGDAP